jgi:hypothetical protein
MRKIPFQVLFFFAVAVVVSLSLVSSGDSGSGQKTQDSISNDYTSPSVSKKQQPMYIGILKRDRACLIRFRLHAPGSMSSSAELSRQSYNSIAPQMSPRLLKENELPQSLQ